MLQPQSYPILFLALLLVSCSGNEKQGVETNTLVDNSTTETEQGQDSSATSSPNSNSSSTTGQTFPSLTDSTTLTVALLRSDGTLFPIAQLNGQWSDPWTESFEGRPSEWPPAPEMRIPEIWKVYSGGAGDSLGSLPETIHSGEKKVVEMACDRNYVIKTDWRGANLTVTKALGLALSKSVETISEKTIPEIQKIRKEHEIMNRDPWPEGVQESPSTYRPNAKNLGYFAANGDTIGVYVENEYMGEDYSVYRISNGVGIKLMFKSGGSC